MMRLLKKVFIDDSALLKFSVLLSIALFCLGWRTSVQAGPNQESNATINTDPIKATASLKLNPLHQGSNSSLRIDLELAPGFHAYLDQFKLNVLEPEGLQLNQLDISPVVEFPDGVSKKIKKGVKGKAQIHTVLGVPEGFPTGTTPAFLELTYQACTLTYCLLPKKIRLPLEFQVSPAFGSVQRLETNSTLDIRENTETDPKTGQKLSPTGKGDESIFVLVQAKGWWLVFVTVFFAGVLTSFTPCVFPMIPITLAVIGSRGPNLSKWRSLLTSLIYVFGIALSYSVLGLFAALTGSLFGSLLGHPLVAVSLALIFLVMALA
ncbi:MAG: hypothetical protein KDD35_12525, partial [Bdellovibrionales bacterium]|nr:hypothetical protein [Bdellovibrionales bacterium]